MTKERTHRVTDAADAERFAVSGDHVSTPRIGSLVAEVVGAGYIAFGQERRCMCGDANGMVVSAGWSRYGYSGGVMDRQAVRELRDYLTQWLDGTLPMIEPEPVENNP